MIPIRYNLRSMAVRKSTTIASCLGIALVVFALASALMMVNGIHRVFATAGRPDVAVIMSTGAAAETESNYPADLGTVPFNAPQVVRNAGQPVGVVEVVTVAAMPKVSGGISNLLLRGTTPEGKPFRPGLKVIAGQLPRPGTNEAMMGQGLVGRFAGLALGNPLELRRGRDLHIVGIFADGGSANESEIFCDRDYLMAAYGRLGVVSSARVLLTSASSYEPFRQLIEHDQHLPLKVWRESTYLEERAGELAPVVQGLGGLISFFFAIGATLGATITMYAAVANRSREIGTLRAIGFSRSDVLASFLFESVALTFVGGIIGALASLPMQFLHVSMMGPTWSELVFKFELTPGELGFALGAAAVMGVVGGLFPAVRASRLSPVLAMRGA